MFDPTLPIANSPNSSAQMRAQLNGLKDLIDAVPTISGAVVDGVSTGNPGDPASVMLSLSSGTLHFSFTLPRGNDGAAGPVFGNTLVDGVTTLNPGDAATVQTSFDGSNVRFLFGIPRGSDGSNGINGSDGAPGTPITNFIVDGVNTLNPGAPATASANFDGNAVRLLFGIPRGSDGTNGSNGNDGGQGPPFTNFIVDGVNMLNPNDPASVQTIFDGNAVRMIFNLPRGFTGNAGAAGTPGSNGNDGGPGPQGLQGPPFANAAVDSVTTLNPGDNATVQTSFDGSNVRFQFGIPRGQNGNDGGSGPQGQPGEVTTMQLNSAINGTSNLSNGVNTLDTTFPNTDAEILRQKLNELILALRR